MYTIFLVIQMPVSLFFILIIKSLESPIFTPHLQSLFTLIETLFYTLYIYPFFTVDFSICNISRNGIENLDKRFFKYFDL